MSTEPIKTGTIIEGVGDEVLFGISGILAIIIPTILCCYIWYLHCPVGMNNRVGWQRIHRESQEAVNVVRQEVIESRSENLRTGRVRDTEMNCPICLGSVIYAIETNCAHVFCSQCMIMYWRHGNWINGVKCPVCRSQVNILLQYFTSEESSQSCEEKAEIMQQIIHYNRRYSGEPIPLMDRIRDLPTLLRHLWTEFFSVEGLVLVFRLRILVLFLLALCYFVSPLDIIPEAAFGILGFIDDLFIIFLLAIYLTVMYRQFVAARGGGAPAD